MPVIREVFSSADYCRDELQRIHETMGSRSKFTPKAADAIGQTLALMLIHCPQEVLIGVNAALIDLSYRRVWLGIQANPRDGKGEKE